LIRKFDHLIAAATVLVGVVFTNIARADVVDFADLADPGISQSSTLPNPYHGFQWDNFAYTNAGTFLPSTPGSTSSTLLAFNNSGAQADILNNSSTFTVTTLTAGAGWNDGLNLVISGFDGGNLMDSTAVVLNTITSTSVTLDWFGVTDLRFTSSGGTANPSLNGSGTQFALDNISLYPAIQVHSASAPEPGKVSLLAGVAAAGLLLAGRRRSSRRS